MWLDSCSQLAFVWNTLLAPCLLNERLTSIRVGAAATIFVGTIMVGLGQPRDEIDHTGSEYFELLTQPHAIAYYCVESVGVFICFMMWRRDPSSRAAVVGAGWLAGNQYLEKAAVELLDGSWQFWVLIIVYALVVVGSAVVLGAAMRGAEALDAVATFLAVQIITGAIASALVLDEMQTSTGGTLALYIIGLLTISGALLVLAQPASSLPCADREVEMECYDTCAKRCAERTDALVGGKLLDGKADRDANEESKAAPVEGTSLLEKWI